MYRKILIDVILKDFALSSDPDPYNMSLGFVWFGMSRVFTPYLNDRDCIFQPNSFIFLAYIISYRRCSKRRVSLRILTLNKRHIESAWALVKHNICIQIYKIEWSVSKWHTFRLVFGRTHPSYPFLEFKLKLAMLILLV